MQGFCLAALACIANVVCVVRTTKPGRTTGGDRGPRRSHHLECGDHPSV